ncbi:hypothetical protein F5984_19985 [Rudanella paleaurantiibacter]|uniref:RelA/SpoT domain-containing protein n=1 Tax=Rudanella paleaurantiibacter TaxID=2614655 RepID=A0A7J5TVD3_9BACT|nr:RelA/SpoT domain-containing protein [Rudanella paleaurantiibacter]KAB7728037.1 hypothetical protein F5984_19985 [Rudanella paleaurantiibacter]
MNQAEKYEQALRQNFRDLIPHLKDWGKKVDQTIADLVKDLVMEKRVQMSPDFRIKQEDSFIKKVTVTKKYNNPITDTSDKVATRIVLLTTNDVKEVSERLKAYASWNISHDKDWEKEIEKAPNSFGYQSAHFVVWPIEKASDELDVLALKCEIQVRTLLQHAYAEVSHDHVYKGPYKSDKAILRKLARSMALMESTDEYFGEIFEMIREPENPENELMKVLKELYKDLAPSVHVYEDQDMSDLFLPLYTDKPFPVEKLKNFVRRSPELVNWIQRSKLLLFTHPIVLMLAYLLNTDPDYLKDNWPSSHQQLEALHIGLGHSFADY